MAVVADLALDEVGVQDAERSPPTDESISGRVRADRSSRRRSRVAPRSERARARSSRRRAISTSASIQVDAGVDDRDAGEHVALEDLAARLGGDQREVGAVVDAEVHVRVGGPVGGDALAALAQQRQHVAEVVLAGLVVVA